MITLRKIALLSIICGIVAACTLTDNDNTANDNNKKQKTMHITCYSDGKPIHSDSGYDFQRNGTMIEYISAQNNEPVNIVNMHCIFYSPDYLAKPETYELVN